VYLNVFNSGLDAGLTGSAESEETAARILNAALELFRVNGFDTITMRQIAQKAGVATGAPYYYYSSKDAIVLEFYRRANEQLQPKIESALQGVRSLERRLYELIRVKLTHFHPDRQILKALLRNGVDPKYPLSPFSKETKLIRDADITCFAHILNGCGMRLPRDLSPVLPGVLWFFQMGIILFWLVDDSPGQVRTARLLEQFCKSAAMLIRLSAIPLLRPLRKTVLGIVATVTGAEL
jgi:AcrR family transcriptional regulator